MLYPQNDDRFVAIDSVASLHPVYNGVEFLNIVHVYSRADEQLTSQSAATRT